MHPIFGHLIALGKISTKLPVRAHAHTLPPYLMREYDLPSMFFMDARPIATLNLVIADPYVSHFMHGHLLRVVSEKSPGRSQSQAYTSIQQGQKS
jgi:hypothetical protein